MRVLEYLPEHIQKNICSAGIDLEKCCEVRVRTGCPIIVRDRFNEYFVWKSNHEKVIATNNDVQKIYKAVNDFSIYAHSDSIRQGFITIKGGHRVGFLGQAVIENNHIKTIKNISFINIRISHEIKGISNQIVNDLYEDEQILNTLIISPPGKGKTTLIRDIVRNISNGIYKHKGKSISVIDERSEIAACYLGIPENDVGIRTDVLDNCPKSEGMILALRSMSPEVIAVDEIGTSTDVESLKYIKNCGCSVIATIHGSSKEDLEQRPYVGSLIKERYFKRFIIIGKDGKYRICT